MRNNPRKVNNLRLPCRMTRSENDEIRIRQIATTARYDLSYDMHEEDKKSKKKKKKKKKQIQKTKNWNGS